MILNHTYKQPPFGADLFCIKSLLKFLAKLLEQNLWKGLFLQVSKDVACRQNNNCNFITQCTINNRPLPIFC